MLRRAPSLAFSGLIAAALGVGLAEVIVVTSLAVASGVATLAWHRSGREARPVRSKRAGRLPSPKPGATRRGLPKRRRERGPPSTCLARRLELDHLGRVRVRGAQLARRALGLEA